MNFRVVGIVNDVIELEDGNKVHFKKVKIEPFNFILKNITIPDEYKDFISVVYDKGQVLYMELLVPNTLHQDILSFVNEIKRWDKEIVVIDEGAIL